MNRTTTIFLVQGNTLKLAIPLTLRTISSSDGNAVCKDDDFIPSSDSPVTVELTDQSKKLAFEASMEGNVAVIEDRGNIPTGFYAVSVLCKDNEGNPYRFKQKAALRVVDTTEEAGITSPIEYEAKTWYLNAAIYLALKGEGGGGTVTAVKMNNDEPISPDGDGIVNLGTVLTRHQDISGKVDKESGKSLMTNAEHGKLANLPTASELNTTFGTKADKSTTYTKTDADNKFATKSEIPTLPQNIVQSVTINGNTVTPNQQTGNVDLGSVQGQKGDKGDKGDTGSVVVTDGVAQIAIRNDLTTGGTGDALSAEMGKYLKTLLDSYESRMDALEESGAILMSMSGKTLVISRITDPIVLAGDLTRTELNAVAGGSSIPSVFFISGRNLAGNIGIALSDSTNFTLSTSSLMPVDGKVATTMVSVTYTPASGAAADTTHNCNVVITYDGTTKKTMSLSGTVAASPSLELTPSSLTLKAIENGQTSGTIRVEALALSGDVTLELSGSGLSFADDESVTTKTIARADAEDGIDVTIYYTAGSSDVTGTLTASSTGVTSVTATINGVVAVPLAVGSYWLVNNPQGGKLKYVVTSATNRRVSVEGSGNVVSSQANPLIIPASVNDSEATVYDSGGNVVASSGLDYAVTSVADAAFQNTKGTNIHTIVLPEGLTTIAARAFRMNGDYGTWGCIKKVVIPSTLTSIGQHAFNNTGITEFDASQTSGLYIDSYAFYGAKSLRKLKLKGGTVRPQAFNGCPQFNGTGTNPVVVSYAQSAPSYAAEFKQSGASTVTAKLYCPNVSAYNAAGWNIFTSVQDINEYTE